MSLPKFARIRWSDEELELLRKVYVLPDVPMEEIVSLFKYRSPQSVWTKARELGLIRGSAAKDRINREALERLKKVYKF